MWSVVCGRRVSAFSAGQRGGAAARTAANGQEGQVRLGPEVTGAEGQRDRRSRGTRGK